MASLHLRNFQDAIKDCEEALKLDPNNEDLLHNKTEILKAIEQLNNEALRKAETQEITTDK
jgi:tetratricopeptide (TPR) repeat protein